MRRSSKNVLQTWTVGHDHLGWEKAERQRDELFSASTGATHSGPYRAGRKPLKSEKHEAAQTIELEVTKPAQA